jgi:hypothetical protein
MIVPPTINLDSELCEEREGAGGWCCAEPAHALIWHDRDREAYKMCEAHAEHNVNNRGAILLAVKNSEK